MDVNTNVIEGIIDEFLYRNKNRYDSAELDLSYDDKLQVILSESIQALAFVTTIEDEFDIEFDDDEIDMEFFMSVSTILRRIQGHLESQSL
jgi:acyl carrier protein